MGKWQTRISNPDAGGGGPTVTDHFGPTIVVGNVLAGDPAVLQAAPFQYVPDPGDGTGIQIAFAAAAASPDGAWVHIRRGLYTLVAGVLPLTVAGFKVTGDGWSTRLVQPAATRNVFRLTLDAGFLRIPELRDLAINGTQAVDGAVGTSMIDASAPSFAHIERVDILQLLPSIINPFESLTSMIVTSSSVKVRRCQIAGDSNAQAPIACIRITDDLCFAQDNVLGGCDYGLVIHPGIDRATVTNNQLGNNALRCIELWGRHHICMGNRGGNSPEGIVTNGSRGVITGNSMSNNIAGDPIRLNAASSQNVVGFNTIGGGVVVDSGTGNEVTHNI